MIFTISISYINFSEFSVFLCCTLLAKYSNSHTNCRYQDINIADCLKNMFYLSKTFPQSNFSKPRPFLKLGNDLYNGQNCKIDITSNGIFVGSFDEKILQNWIGNYQNVWFSSQNSHFLGIFAFSLESSSIIWLPTSIRALSCDTNNLIKSKNA